MFTAAEYRELVSGRRRGLAPALLRGLLACGEWPYAAAMRLRNRRFDRKPDRVQRVDVPVISVGNITLGGTGKTPMVEWLARWFLQRGVRVGLISRGYKANSTAGNDEALELAHKLPGVPHIQQRDRVAAAQRAITEHGCQLLLLDDAFQHRRIHRDLDIVLIDALEPFGFEHVFPRGMLREPLAGLQRADVIALSRAEAVTDEARSAIRQQVQHLAPQSLWIELSHQPLELLSADGQQQPMESLCGRAVAAFCGIGNPAGFRHTLESCGAKVQLFREFPDHRAYTPADLEELCRTITAFDDDLYWVCTHKDLVKLPSTTTTLSDRPLWALMIGMAVRAELDALERRLDALLANAASGCALPGNAP